jgi:hypothetical protein
MVPSLQKMLDVSRRELGAGALAAVAAVGASLVALAATADPLALRSGTQYWILYAPGFAFVAGFIVGAVVWWRTMSPAATPRHGLRAGIVTAVGTVVVVPILIGLYALVFPVLLSVATGQELQAALALYPAHVWTSLGITWDVAVGWSPVVGVVLLPLGALLAWIYQGGLRAW